MPFLRVTDLDKIAKFWSYIRNTLKCSRFKQTLPRFHCIHSSSGALKNKNAKKKKMVRRLKKLTNIKHYN